MAAQSYAAFGLLWRSAIELPFAAPQGAALRRHPDVTVRLGETPARLAGAAGGTPHCWEAQPGQALLRVPGIARYLATPAEVVVEPRGGSEDDVLTFLIGPVLTALLQLHGMTVLRAAAIEAGAGAVLLLGDSGTGKSVLARALAARGHGLLADHGTALTPATDSHGPIVQPAYPRLRLWADSLPKSSRGPRVRAGLAKYWCEAERFATVPRPAHAVFWLQPYNRTEFDVERLPGSRAFWALWAHTSRKRLLDALAQRQAQYLAALELAHRPFFRLRRPDHPLRVDELADRVAEQLRGINARTADSAPAARPQLTRQGTAAQPRRRQTDRRATPGPGMFWLASYPKSGSTWLRAVLTNYLQDGDEGASINALVGSWSLYRRGNFDELIGLDSADLRADEVAHYLPRFRELLADTLSRRRRDAGDGARLRSPHFAKTHEAFQGPSGGARFSPVGTVGAVYLLRNPLDVAVSYAHHLQWPIDRTLQRMANPAADEVSGVWGIRGLLPNPLRTWSEHVASWLDQRVLPTCVSRYEDLLADPRAGFGRIVRFAGLEWDADRLARAIDRAAFSRLRAQESEQGFDERQQTAPSFFRAGVAGAWRAVLTRSQVEACVATHGRTMARLGYLREAEAFLSARAGDGCAGAKDAAPPVA